MDRDTSFGSALRRARRARDLTQQELARLVGCAEVTIQKIETEARRPSKAIAERLAAVLELGAGERAAFVRWARGGVPAADVRAVPAPRPAPPDTQYRPGNLPLERTSFVGRAHELDAVRALLATHRLVTLTGSGGTGKTRFALRLASHVTGAFPDGSWVVSLEALQKPSQVIPAVATALGLRNQGSRSLQRTLLAWLRERRLLLLLDNCEHLVLACARLADAVLQLAPDVRLLATSRVPLSTAGEVTFVVPPLGVPGPDSSVAVDVVARSEAVQLFVERAAAVQPGFALRPGNVAAVAQLCRQLDGIPLAIELAAARVRVLTVEHIVARLTDRFALLTGGPRTELPRQQTLLASLDWSYDLLSPAEQTLLRRLATFTGGWTLEAAEAVCSDPELPRARVLNLLTRLVDSSLVVAEHDGGVRYRLLETIRQYALDKLRTSSELGTMKRRHAVYYLARAHATDTADQSPYAIEREWDNVRAAQRWMLETGDVELGSHLADALALMEWSLARSRQLGNRAHECNVLYSLGLAAREAGNSARATERLGEAFVLAGELDEHELRGWIQVSLGGVAVMDEDIAQATTWLTAGLAALQHVDDQAGVAWALNHLGHVAQLEGHYARAAELHAQSLPLFSATDRQGVAWAHAGSGEAALAMGDASQAQHHFTESLRIFGELSDSAIGWSLAGLAGVAVLRDEAALATRLWGAVDALRARSQRRPAPTARATYERLLAHARARLDQATFEAAWSDGQRLTLEEALALVASET